MNTTGWWKGLRVTGDGTGTVSHAGVALLRAWVDKTGLTGGLSGALASRRLLVHDRGRVLADLACAIVDGAEVISDFRVMADQGGLFGPVASVPTCWRTLKEIAEILEMTPDELDGIATCYNLIFRKPVGHHVILLCDSVSCWIMGYNRILDNLKSRLGIEFGQTTTDGRFTLLPIVCLGMCDHAPAMMIDEDLILDAAPQKLDAVFGRYT